MWEVSHGEVIPDEQAVRGDLLSEEGRHIKARLSGVPNHKRMHERAVALETRDQDLICQW